jgi:ankyrin repeat protein
MLMAAASEGLLESVDALVNLGASVGAVGTSGMTALHEASANGHIGTARRLLELGAAVDTETDDGVTPFMCAAGAN